MATTKTVEFTFNKKPVTFTARVPEDFEEASGPEFYRTPKDAFKHIIRRVIDGQKDAVRAAITHKKDPQKAADAWRPNQRRSAPKALAASVVASAQTVEELRAILEENGLVAPDSEEAAQAA